MIFQAMFPQVVKLKKKYLAKYLIQSSAILLMTETRFFIIYANSKERRKEVRKKKKNKLKHLPFSPLTIYGFLINFNKCYNITYNYNLYYKFFSPLQKKTVITPEPVIILA